MTTFLTGNAMLWYDTPTLRHLVILDVKWVVDAATCFIRQYNLKDHAENYERMAALDERARREEPGAWDLLTKGSAILQRKVAATTFSTSSTQHPAFTLHHIRSSTYRRNTHHPLVSRSC